MTTLRSDQWDPYYSRERYSTELGADIEAIKNAKSPKQLNEYLE